MCLAISSAIATSTNPKFFASNIMICAPLVSNLYPYCTRQTRRGVTCQKMGFIQEGVGLGKELQFTGAGDGLRPAVDAEFAIDFADIPLDGAQRKHQFTGDFAVGMPMGDQ